MYENEHPLPFCMRKHHSYEGFYIKSHLCEILIGEIDHMQ